MSDSVLDEARRHHRKQVNAVLRRPGMYGRDETAEFLLFGAMAAVDGSSPRWEAEYDSLRNQFFSNTGVSGAYRRLLPAGALRDATASIYAGIAHRCGWLDLDRTLSATEYQQLVADISEWVMRDRTLPEVVDRFGTPSLWVGGNNPLWPKTLCYATASPYDEMICFHLWNSIADAEPGAGPLGVLPEPVLLAVRHRSGDSPFSFSFTPEGSRRRPAAGPSPVRSTVWIFHDDQAVFETEEAGLAWAAEHGVTGVLAEYPSGGAPGLRRLHLVDGRPAIFPERGIGDSEL